MSLHKDGLFKYARRTVLAVFTHLLTYFGAPATLLLALGSFAWRVSRAVLLHRAGSAALKHGSKDRTAGPA